MIRLLLPMFSIRRRFAAWVASAVGRLHFGLGSLAASRRYFEKVLELKGDDFTAYVYLARIAYRYRDVGESMREFENARRTDPERFVRLRLPLELHRADLAGLGEFPGERTCWSPVSVSHRARPRGEQEEGDPDQEAGELDPADGGRFFHRRAHDRRDLEDHDVDGAELDDMDRSHPDDRRRGGGRRAPAGDFSSHAEARRFRDRSPIRREEIAGLDWTRFMREVTRSAASGGSGPGRGRDPEV